MIDVGALAQPIMGLIGGFGTGVAGGDDPAAMLRTASQTLEGVHAAGRDGLVALEGAWNGKTAVEALTTGSSVQTALGETADRGNSVAGVVDAAAVDVRGGVGELEEILRSFVATVTAAIPLLATPAGQTMIVAAATEHLGRALAVVSKVQAALAEHVTTVTALAPGEVLPIVPTMAASVVPAVQSIIDDAGTKLTSAVSTSSFTSSATPVATDLGGSPSYVQSGYHGSSDGTRTIYSNASLGTSSAQPTGPLPSGDVGSWISQALEVLRSMGYDTSQIDPRQLALIIAHESAGDPHAINLWDSNAAAGTPSKGIMQTIDSTFHAYKAPGHEDIWNPVDNIVAATRYAIDRYGSVAGVPGVAGVSSGGGYVGY